MSDATTPQTNLENLTELLGAIGYAGRISVERTGSDRFRYRIDWPLPDSFGTPSGLSIEEAATNGIAILMTLVWRRYAECTSAIASIDRICGPALHE